MNAHYYDIESLDNAFTLADWRPKTNTVAVYVIDDDNLMNAPFGTAPNGGVVEELTRRVREANRETSADINVELHSLHTQSGIVDLLRHFGCEFLDSVQVPDKNGQMMTLSVSTTQVEPAFRLTCDTDKNYDRDRDYYLMGYNSYQYDTTMLAELLGRAVKVEYSPERNNYQLSFYMPTAAQMRAFNDSLFRPEFKGSMPTALRCTTDSTGRVMSYDINKTPSPASTIRRNWLRTGRYIDVARLNEKQARVGLKRLLGMLGYQILESDKLSGSATRVNSLDELMDLIAYNVSDVVNLEKLMENKLYSSAFELKRGMLETYPELVYDDKGVRYNRLFCDSTSQQLSARSLSPNTSLRDKPTVSLMYPHESKATDDNPCRDILDDTRRFFEHEVDALNAPEHLKREARQALEPVWDAYGNIRDTNFNSSESQPGGETASQLRDIESLPVCVPYFGPDCKPTSCFATFSTGGIHGAEYNKALYDADMRAWHEQMGDLQLLQGQFGANDNGALQCRLSVARLADPMAIEFPSGKTHLVKDFLTSNSTRNAASWREPAKPQLFVRKSNGGTALNKRYAYTSAGESNHEDFSSYYPNLLRQMNVFASDDVKNDRYGEIFDNKQALGRTMSDPNVSPEEREVAAIKRAGVKLILNTASGAGDANFDNPVRMNNNIIAMRCIGQLFTWRIAQAQAFRGASVPSTNTDGLYTFMEESVNNRILEEQAASIGVEIEPMRTIIISKDANNRVEWHVDENGFPHVDEAAGELAAYHGPNCAKSLNHPAICDRVLTDYMIRTYLNGGAEALSEPFDEELGYNLLVSLIQGSDTYEKTIQALLMFQNIVASSTASNSYVFGSHETNVTRTDDIQLLQHYNRVFYVCPERLPGYDTVHLHQASAFKVSSTTIKSRERRGDQRLVHDPCALHVLKANDVKVENLNAEDREAKVRVVSGIDPTLDVLIENHALHGMDYSRAYAILTAIDIDAYLSLICNRYENNWRNRTTNPAPATKVERRVRGGIA